METNCRHCFKQHSLFYFKNRLTTHLVYRCSNKTTRIQSKGKLVYTKYQSNLDIPIEKSKLLREQENQISMFG
jgi:hypothetical protein